MCFFWLTVCFSLALVFQSLVSAFFKRLSKPSHRGNVLIVTAHPDDETMFFGPSIVNLTHGQSGRQKAVVHLLCLSDGNYYGDGSRRRQELLEACRVLGVESEVVEDETLQDNPELVWPREVIVKHVKRIVDKKNIDTVVTFDSYGVSGHANHRQVFEALRDSSLDIWTLESVAVWRKYLSVLDLPITLALLLLASDCQLQAIGLADYCTLMRALFRHESQMLWFRYLYSISSRYMFINTLKHLKK